MTQWYRRRVATGVLALLLCALLPGVAGCGQARASQPGASPTTGWTTYRDAHYDFQVPAPPGWQAMAQPDDGCSTSTDCDYMVVFWPPDGAARLPVSEQVYIRVVSRGARGEWKPVDDPDFRRDAHDVTIATTAAPLYDLDTTGWIQRAAAIYVDDRQFIFGLIAPSDRAQRDLAVYQHMLKKFTYSGK